MNRMKILWLCSWYPNRNDPFDGDFVQRHAQAAALYNDVHVIALKSWKENDQEITRNHPGLTEQVVYRRKSKNHLQHLLYRSTWFHTYKKAIQEYIRSNGIPDVVHVHVPWKDGLLAVWMKRKFSVPYVITEHWGIYNNVVETGFSQRSFLFQQLTRLIFRHAAHMATVSSYIAEAINQLVLPISYTVIRNTVDTNLFYIEERPRGKPFTFIHVSNLAPVKNFNGILEAIHLLHPVAPEPFRLVVIGNRNEEYVEKARSWGLLNSIVFFEGERSYSDVARSMRTADCLVLNSFSENSPCVIGEALCTGLPVITTLTGGVPELVHNGNSIPAAPGKPEQLAAAMEQMLQQWAGFNGEEISREAKDIYSYEKIGGQLNQLYAGICGSRE